MSRYLLLLVCACLSCSAWAITIVPAAPDAVPVGGPAVVPLRPMAELTGATLEARGKTVIVQRGDHRLVYDLRADTARDGVHIGQPFTARGTLYVPLRPLVEGWGGTLTIDNAQGVMVAKFPDPALSLTLPIGRHFGAMKSFDHEWEVWSINLDGTGRRRLTYNTVRDALPVFTADGKSLLESGGEYLTLRALDDPNGRRLLATEPGTTLTDIVCAPDGSAFCGVKSGYLDPPIMLISSDGKLCKEIGNGYAPQFSPDGRLIAFASTEGKLIVVTSEGAPFALIDQGEKPFFSPDGRWLYFRCNLDEFDEDLPLLWRFAVSPDDLTGEAQLVLLPPWGVATCTLTPDGAEFIFSGHPKQPGIYRMSVDGGDPTCLAPGQYEHPFVSPDGTKIGCWNNGVLWVMDRDGANRREVTLADTGHPAALFTPDSRQLVFWDYPPL